MRAFVVREESGATDARPARVPRADGRPRHGARSAAQRLRASRPRAQAAPGDDLRRRRGREEPAGRASSSSGRRSASRHRSSCAGGVSPTATASPTGRSRRSSRRTRASSTPTRTDLAIEKVRKSGRDLLTLESPPTRRARRRPSPTRRPGGPRQLRSRTSTPRTCAPRSTPRGDRSSPRSANAGRSSSVVEDIHWADPRCSTCWRSSPIGWRGRFCSCVRRGPTSSRRDRAGAAAGATRRRSRSIRSAPRIRSTDRRSCSRSTTCPPSVHDRILERAEGNPFFLEEIVRTPDRRRPDRPRRRPLARDRGHRGGGDPRHGAGRPRRADRPARPRDKRIAQAAAVVGRVFWPGPVAASTGVDAGRPGRRVAQRSRTASWCCLASGRRSRASPSTSSSTSSRATSRTSRSRGGSARGRTPRSRRGSSAPPATARSSSPRYSRTTTGPPRRSSATRGPRPTRRCADPRARVAAARLPRRPPPVRREEGRAPRRGSARLRDRAARARRRADDARRGVLHRLPRRPRVAILPRGRDPARLGRPAGRPSSVAYLAARACDVTLRWPGSMTTVPTETEVRAVLDLGFANVPPGDSEERSACSGCTPAGPSRSRWPRVTSSRRT